MLDKLLILRQQKHYKITFSKSFIHHKSNSYFKFKITDVCHCFTIFKFQRIEYATISWISQLH